MWKSLVATFVFCLVLLTPTIQAQIVTTVDVDLGNDLVIVIGSGFGPASQVFMGAPNGALDQLAVINSGPNFAVATLLTTDPGNYLVLLSPSFAAAYVTIAPPQNPNIITEDDPTRNTAVGVDTLSSNTGTNNTAMGMSSLLTNTTGADNSAMGLRWSSPDSVDSFGLGNQATSACFSS